MEYPELVRSMPLTRGTRLGPYEIEEPVGSGGMGEVYRARDTRLPRVVAIKVMTGAASASAAMRKRFDSEAHAIATISHPNICTLYDVGHHEGTDFLVMEFLRGETLASRLARQRGPLPLHETLSIATQLADAFAAAHRGGVLHRDLKPANIMLTPPGVKVLDFGLAKLEATPSSSSLDFSTRVTSTLTERGSVIGTVPYMSPEQLEGRPVDARSDIFALGAVIFEMLAGKRAFPGDSNAGVIAAILERDPPTLVHYETPAAKRIERVARKCLAKHPDARWQSASDIADELRWIATEESSVSTAAPTTDRPRRRWTAVALAIVGAAAAAAVWLSRSTEPQSAPVTAARFLKATLDGNVRVASLSPDGRTVAYVAGVEPDLRLRVHDLDGGPPLEIWNNPPADDLRWLPNGTQLLATGDSGTWLLPRFGGPAQRLATEATFVAPAPDGTQFAQTSFTWAGFRLVSLNGRSETEIAMKGFLWVAGLDWNAATNRVVLLTTDTDENTIVWSTRPDGSEVQRMYTEPLFVRTMCADPVTGTVYAIRLRNEEEEVIRIPRATSTTGSEVLHRLSPATAELAGCNVSSDGRRLLYIAESGHANLWRLDLETPARAATLLTPGTAWFSHPAVTPDGQSIVAAQGRFPNSHLVKLPVDGGPTVRLTAGTAPSISEDGQRLAYVVRVAGRGYRVWTSDLAGRGTVELADATTNVPARPRWLPDGRLAWQTPNGRDHRIRDMTTGREEWLVGNDAGWTFEPHFSPNRDLIAFHWNRGAPSAKDSGLWLLSWPGRQRRLLAVGLFPLGWSSDGRWVYAFRGLHQIRTVLRVSVATGAVETVASFPRGYFSQEMCTQTPDRRALICAMTESSRDAWVIDGFDRR